jgi:hypothetical protein
MWAGDGSLHDRLCIRMGSIIQAPQACKAAPEALRNIFTFYELLQSPCMSKHVVKGGTIYSFVTTSKLNS